MVVVGTDSESIYHGQAAPGRLTGSSSCIAVFWSRVGGSADAEPSLATDGSRLYLAVKGLDSRIYVNIWSGSWSGWERIPTGSTKSGPAAAIRLVGGHLYVIVRGSDNRIYYT